MKKILALTLALMLALSLTAALAVTEAGTTNINLQVNLSNQQGSTDIAEMWDVDFSVTNLIWSLIQTDKGSIVSGTPVWNPNTDSYDPTGVMISYDYNVALAEGEEATKVITITNKSNFDVHYECALTSSGAFGGAFNFDGTSIGTLVNKSSGIKSADVKVTISTTNLQKMPEPIKGGSVGSLGITLSRSGPVYPFVP